MALFSIFGANGFIGRHVCAYLEQSGHEVHRFSRTNRSPDRSAVGHAVYCIGLTADFRDKPTETARAHVGLLADLLDSFRFESVLYLSSTRVYAGAEGGHEDAPLLVRPSVPDQLYNLSKLAGESLCLTQKKTIGRVARLSNVIGSGADPSNFLTSVVDEARRQGQVIFHTSPQSLKDYVDIDDVCSALAAIALDGNKRIYNVASGVSTSNAEVGALITQFLSADVAFAANAPTIAYPVIDIERLRSEFSFTPKPFAIAFKKFTETHPTPARFA
jgi:nucleoside-diphosphate-sugar epimerase